MEQTTRFYPRVQVDTSPSGAVGQAGGVLLTETVAVTGLAQELSAVLAPWRKPLARHDPATGRFERSRSRASTST